MVKWLKLFFLLIVVVLLASLSRGILKDIFGPGILVLLSDIIFIFITIQLAKKYGFFKRSK